MHRLIAAAALSASLILTGCTTPDGGREDTTTPRPTGEPTTTTTPS